MTRYKEMMTTSRYICDMLYKHECVIIPYFGAFVTTCVPATIDQKRGIMLPPRKEIAFNRNLAHNDGVLAAHIADVCNISVDDATKIIAEYAAALNKSLEQNGRAVVDSVGTFHAFGDKIAFLPVTTNDFMIESYGLSAMPLPVISEKKATLRIAGFKRVAASVALLIGLLLVAPETRDPQNIAEYTKASVAEVSLPRPMVAEEAHEDVIEEVSQPSQPAETFYIIVGSFPTEREANAFIKSMNKRGVDGLTKMPYGKRTRVAAGEFNDHEEAVVNNRAIRRIKGFEKAWVLRSSND